MSVWKDEDESFDVPMTPLIDVVFLLLIFFLVATTFSRSEIDQQVTLPETEGGVRTEKEETVLVINIRREGMLVLNGNIVAMDSLKDTVSAWRAENPGRPVAIRGDEGVSYGRVAQVMGICRSAGVLQIDLPVVAPDAEG